jgi:hypothetical protein
LLVAFSSFLVESLDESITHDANTNAHDIDEIEEAKKERKS